MARGIYSLSPRGKHWALVIGLLVLPALLTCPIYGARCERLTSTEFTAAWEDSPDVQVDEIHQLTYYPGPMAAGEEGVGIVGRFGDRDFEALIVEYRDCATASTVTSSVNQLDERMGGTFGQAFRKGTIVVLIDAGDARTSRAIFEAMTGR